MWKAPNRPRNEISQTYNDGIVIICEVIDVAEPGYAPKEELLPKYKIAYAERQMGVQRYYAAQQNQIQIERVIRVQRGIAVDNQNVAITEDGHQYRIDLVQAVIDVYPPSLDITLARIDHDYEVIL